jgi:two-component system, chemotaxis family, chemotaxis protein CheY
MPPRVLVVDDLPMMRQALRAVIEEAGFVVAGEAIDGNQGVVCYMEMKPDVVLLDIVMPKLDGIAALKQLIRIDPGARVIMCSALGEQSLIFRAIQLGARDFIVKPFRPQRVVESIRRVTSHAFR